MARVGSWTSVTKVVAPSEMNSLRDVLWLGNTFDELGNEAVDILVDNQVADLLHCAVRSLLDFSLGIPHGF